jgi:hypothetical protein
MPKAVYASPLNRPLITALFTLVAVLGGLITSKAGHAMRAISKVADGGTISTKTLWFDGGVWAESFPAMVHLVNYMG